MDYRRFGNTIIARMDKGEEILEQVKEIALREKISLASVQALGAVDQFTVGVFNTMHDEFYCHLHMSAGNEKGEVFGGHLNRAVISATCEMVIHVIDGKVDRYHDEEIGLNLFRF